MKKIFVEKITVNQEVSLKEAADLLEKHTSINRIETINWDAFPYRPDLKFRIAHCGTEIWIKFYVKEKNILARETSTNGPVYKDSTVEFFVSLDDKNYYNFEFNCIGTIHIAYGPGRENRTPIAPEIAEQIEIKSSLGNQPFEEKHGNFVWNMMIRIPIETFTHNRLKTFNRTKATGNFYKCGDDTSDPHFVTWNEIETENPDYHRPEFFGKLEFD